MTAVRRRRPLRAPVVSSSAVGSASPRPRRPPVIRMRTGSTRHDTALETDPMTRVPTSRVYARYARLRFRAGSTYGSSRIRSPVEHRTQVLQALVEPPQVALGPVLAQRVQVLVLGIGHERVEGLLRRPLDEHHDLARLGVAA